MSEKKEENLLLRLVPPHPKISREVLESDIERVVSEARVLYNLCFTKNGLVIGAKAMAHSQICNDDPLRFFVTAKKEIIINPVITRHTNTTVNSEEGCYSFADRQPITVQRWHKIEVEYVTIMTDLDNEGKFELSSVQKERLSGLEARIFAHELDHLNSIYIFSY